MPDSSQNDHPPVPGQAGPAEAPADGAPPGHPAGAVPPEPKWRRSAIGRFAHAVVTLPARVVRNAGEVWNDHKVLLVVVGFCVAFAVAFFWRNIFIKIGPGDGGVLYRLFFGGTVTETVYKEGLHVIAPWNTMYIYNARVQQVSDDFTVLSQDGLAIKIEVSIRFRPMFDQLGLLHKHIGPDYIEKVVKPEVQSEFRFLLGKYRPEEIYNSQGFILQNVVQGTLGQLGERYILLDDVLLKAITLPPPVAQAIESKLRAQQLFEEYTYRNQTEEMEAKRKAIEAGGIKLFQDTVMSNMPDFEQYLRYKGIEATLELAKSPNAKTVIIGGGQDRLPLILDGTGRSDGTVPATAPSTDRPRSGSPVRERH